jgi:hypothetical protein
MAPRAPVPLREIVYTLSPYEQNIFKNMFYNWPHTVSEFVKEVRTQVQLVRSAGDGPIDADSLRVLAESGWRDPCHRHCLRQHCVSTLLHLRRLLKAQSSSPSHRMQEAPASPP